MLRLRMTWKQRAHPCVSTGQPIHAVFEHITVGGDGNRQCDPWQVLKGPAKPFRRPHSGFHLRAALAASGAS
jgi:hypothetical protein